MLGIPAPGNKARTDGIGNLTQQVCTCALQYPLSAISGHAAAEQRQRDVYCK